METRLALFKRFFGLFTLGNIVIENLIPHLTIPEDILAVNLQMPNSAVFSDDVCFIVIGVGYALHQFLMTQSPFGIGFGCEMRMRRSGFYLFDIFITKNIHKRLVYIDRALVDIEDIGTDERTVDGITEILFSKPEGIFCPLALSNIVKENLTPAFTIPENFAAGNLQMPNGTVF